ncbi:MAG: hypothetical protein WC481_08900 [Candidatus Omnitrophota bacterium]|jgi:metallophosphoesterase superfamily enzyme
MARRRTRKCIVLEDLHLGILRDLKRAGYADNDSEAVRNALEHVAQEVSA